MFNTVLNKESRYRYSLTQYCKAKLDIGGLPDDALRVKEVYTLCIVTANSGENFEKFLVTDIYFFLEKWRTSQISYTGSWRHNNAYKPYGKVADLEAFSSRVNKFAVTNLSDL